MNAAGLAAHFEQRIHCLAAEPKQTVLRIGVLDGELEVAHATVLLGALRSGYRSIQLRSRQGTLIELCHLLVHVAEGTEPNLWSSADELRNQLSSQQALIEEQAAQLVAKEARIHALEAAALAHVAAPGPGSTDGAPPALVCSTATSQSSAVDVAQEASYSSLAGNTEMQCVPSPPDVQVDVADSVRLSAAAETPSRRSSEPCVSSLCAVAAPPSRRSSAPWRV